GSAKAAADRLVSENLPKYRNEPRGVFTRLIASASRRERLQSLLVDRGAEALPVGEHEEWHYRLVDGGSTAHVVMYKKGSCVVPAGQAPAHDEARELVESVLEGLGGAVEPTAATPVAEPAVQLSDPNVPHIGTDEAGKGDYFGPLV